MVHSQAGPTQASFPAHVYSIKQRGKNVGIKGAESCSDDNEVMKNPRIMRIHRLQLVPAKTTGEQTEGVSLTVTLRRQPSKSQGVER
jgi:hypothetical protein